MKKNKIDFLSDYVVKQYPIEAYKQLIKFAYEFADNFKLTLDEGFDYDSSSGVPLDENMGFSKYRKKSKIESMCLKFYKDDTRMREFLDIFNNAHDFLNKEEQNILDATFDDKLSDVEIMDKYNVNSRYIGKVRKSAIIRFCLKSGLNKVVILVKWLSL